MNKNVRITVCQHNGPANTEMSVPMPANRGCPQPTRPKPGATHGNGAIKIHVAKEPFGIRKIVVCHANPLHIRYAYCSRKYTGLQLAELKSKARLN